MSRTIEKPSPLSLSVSEARERIVALAEPGEAIEVSLGEALGLILAESVEADVDHPPFDHAARDGYAVRAAEAHTGAFLRVIEARRSRRTSDPGIEAGEAARVLAGDPLPPGADSVVRPSGVRPDPATGPTRVIEVRRAAEANRDVTFRGAYLSAGATVLSAGTRIKPALIPLLASQGCVHPLCHRRVRVSIVAVGDQWVGPAEAPTMNRERNATSAALVALTLRAEAMPHDFQAVAGHKVRPTLERASTSPVVIVLGASSRPLARAWQAIGYEPLVAGITAAAIGRVRAGLIRDDEGKVVNHVFHLPGDPVAASAAFALFVLPLIARLQGETTEPCRPPAFLAVDEAHPATRRRSRLVPASIRIDPEGRQVIQAIPGPPADLVGWSQADGVLVLPAQSGPWRGGDPVEFVSLWPRF